MSKKITKTTILKQITLGLIIISVLFIFCGCFENNVTVGADCELIRIHIRANSNSSDDQSVKLKIRDAVTEYLNKELSDVTDRASAYNGLAKHKTSIKAICDNVLRENNFNYSSKLKLNNEYFPTRQYENLTVESGYYDALIIELGDGNGDNWWCVIYPPLCYLEAQGTGDFRYKSKIKELIDKYFG